MSSSVAIRIAGICLAAVLVLPGCSTTQFRDEQTGLSASRTEFGTNIHTMDATVSVMPNGVRTFTIHGAATNQTDAVKAAVEGAVSAAVKAAGKP